MVAGTFVATAPGASAIPTVSSDAAEARVSHWGGSGTTVRGSKWLSGRGVNVYRHRQCTELASRLYAKRGWGHIPSFYGMKPGKKYGPVTFRRNGSGYVPKPGDVVVEKGGSYGHVAVVTKVTKKRVVTVEQNAAANGRHVYPRRGKKGTTVVGAYGPRKVAGYITSARNPHHRNR